MDTKHIHCMLEKISEYGKQMMEAAVGAGNVNLMEAGQIVDMVKDLACAEKDALIAKEMRKASEEDEAEEKYMMKMLKEENKDEYKRMREEYGEDEGERRFYDNYRYANGRFAPKGRGSYEPRRGSRRGRRGYEEPMLYMPMELMGGYDMESLRDMDREDFGRMYYSGGGSGSSGGGSSSGGSSSSGMSGGSSGGNSGGSSRGYSEGYSDGQSRGYEEGNRRGYSEGYEQGSRDGESRGRNRGGNSRYDNARRGYSEGKEQHKGNTQEDNSENMRNLEKLLNIISEDVKEYAPNMSPSEKAMAKQKIESMAKGI